MGANPRSQTLVGSQTSGSFDTSRLIILERDAEQSQRREGMFRCAHVGHAVWMIYYLLSCGIWPWRFGSGSFWVLYVRRSTASVDRTSSGMSRRGSIGLGSWGIWRPCGHVRLSVAFLGSVLSSVVAERFVLPGRVPSLRGRILTLRWCLDGWCAPGGVHTDARTRGFSAEHCIVTR